MMAGKAMPDASRMNVLFVASEADPFIKVGGLADVAGSLPRALKNLNLSNSPACPHIDVRLVIPFHPSILREPYAPQLVAEFPVHTVDGSIQARAYFLEDEGLPIYLIGGEPIDQEAGVYSANLEADGYKYVFFSLACLELVKHLGWQPDILHANDWHTATAVYSLALRRPVDPFFSHTASLLTVHNLPYLGSMTPPAMEAFGLPPAESPDLPAWARQMALPLGLLTADAIVAVSPGYAREILTEEYGSGLAYFLQAQANKISGILNGLDTQKWDPTTDQVVRETYSFDTLADRSANKASLQENMGFEINPHIPLLTMVTRLDPQKGVDLAVEALRSMLQSNDPPFQMIFLGTGNPVLESELRLLEHDFTNAVRAHIVFSELLSHHIYAGADMLLMPSRYEPCGLSQMIAMRYGCVPIARATGGLCDTIHDPADTEQSTGFLFTPPKPEALVNAIHRAINVYAQDPSAWREMQQRGMQQDFSWDRSAQEYLKQYKSLLRSE
jgi:starch synthase